MEGSRIPVLTGCTASGKSAAAMMLADSMDIEIVNADSRQIYRGMDIGTAKPTAEERLRIRHHLLNIINPDETFSAGEFRKHAETAIENIRSRGITPLVVGGSGLYLMALTGSLDDLPKRNEGIRERLKEIESEKKGFLHRFLSAVDSDLAETTGRNDIVRLVRALEIVLQTGYPASVMRSGGYRDTADGFNIIILDQTPDELRTKIHKRTEEMFDTGLVDEVEKLVAKGYGRSSILGRTIGYSEIIDHLDGLFTRVETMKTVEVNTWRFARRQRNIFRRLRNTTSCDFRDQKKLGSLVRR